MRSINMYIYLDIIFIFLLLAKAVSSVRILGLSVPSVADLQEEDITLHCNYDMGGEELNSVKWYKDEEEFFRFTPQGGSNLVFPVVGAHADELSQCNNRRCSVTLTNLNRQSAGVYKCEVSTDAPTFKVAFDAANMTIVARPRGPVTVTIPRKEYSEGDEIRVNCTSPPSDPPPQVRWIVNNQQMNPEEIVATSDSEPDDRGLISRSVAARLVAHRELFSKDSGRLQLKCEVSVPFVNFGTTPLPLTHSIYVFLQEYRGQKFDWLSSSGAKSVAHVLISVCTAFLFV